MQNVSSPCKANDVTVCVYVLSVDCYGWLCVCVSVCIHVYLFLPVSNGLLCQCGGVRETHCSIATGDFFGTAIVSQWDSSQHSSEYPTDAFGELEFAGAGRRHSHVSNTHM